VISGEHQSVAEVVKRAEAEEIRTRQLPVANAFHSQMMSQAAAFLRGQASIPEHLSATSIPLFSSVDGQQVTVGLELRKHFGNQMLSQVDFVSLVKAIVPQCDLMVEVGSGKVLAV
jgi:acyl transferase domain-containing protein